MKPLTILGIETSCDETAAAVLRLDENGPHVLSDIVLGQAAQHAPYKGVVPEIAARAHVEGLDRTIALAMREAGLGFGELDGVAATAGPGLIGGVLVGLTAGKAIALAHGLPLIAVNHLEGHALSPRLAGKGATFPYLLLLVSGGHCQFIAVLDVGVYRRFGTTIDDALGEAFDKLAKLLDLGFPGGPLVEKAAKNGDPTRFSLPRPMLGREGCDFSFAGLKTACVREVELLGARALPSSPNRGRWRVRQHATEGEAPQFAGSGAAPSVTPLMRPGTSAAQTVGPHEWRDSSPYRGSTGAVLDPSQGECALSDQDKADLCASFQAAVLDIVADRTRKAMTMFDPIWGAKGRLVAAGGVAANVALRGRLEALALERSYDFLAPPLKWCTDNAAMIALAGAERLRLGFSDELSFAARPRWPLDEAAAALHPSHRPGRKGAKA